jgi:hypothetical protein
MAQASVLEQKAQEFGIKDYPWEVRVCKRMLQGHLTLLRLSHERVAPKIEETEKELLAIKNYFDDLIDTPTADLLIAEGHIQSVTGILQEIRLAYRKIYAALYRSKDKENAEKDQKEEGKAVGDEVILSCINDISQSLFDCQDAIRRALKCFNDKL